MNKLTIGKLSRVLRARHMTIAGYVPQIITLETGISYKQLVRLKRELKEDNIQTKEKSSALKTSATLIKSRNAKIQASLLMQLYVNLGGKSVLTSIDVAMLEKAFSLYHGLRKELMISGDPRFPAFEISDAWSLAKELRSSEAMLEACGRFQHTCRLKFTFMPPDLLPYFF